MQIKEVRLVDEGDINRGVRESGHKVEAGLIQSNRLALRKMKTNNTFTFVGRVQGVGFRYNAQRFGQQLGLTGWVKNMPDGTVSAEVEGDSEKISEWEGLLGERFEIAKVQKKEKPYQKKHSMFEILR